MRQALYVKMPYRDKEISEVVRGKIKQFYRLLMSYSDFKQANQIAEKILSENLHEDMNKNRILIEALNCAMLVAYARPFSGNDRKAQVRIPDLPDNILRDLSEEEIEIHKIAIEDRNKVLAHSDSDARDYRPEVWLANGKRVLMPWSNDTQAPLTEDATKIFLSLSEKLRERVFEKRMELEPEVIGYFNETPIEKIVDENV